LPTPRRGFLKSLAVVPLLPSAVAAQTPTPAPTQAPPPPASPSPSPAPPGPAAEALTRVVEHRYGSQLEPADLKEIAKGIDDSLQGAERLRKAMKLTNADEPVNTFRARPPARAGRS
jgi:hypothetical protein